MSRTTRVILFANVSHYNYAARALYEAGLLRRYITGIGFGGTDHWLTKLLPAYWRRKSVNRFIGQIDPDYIKSLWIPEIIQRSLYKTGIGVERSNLITCNLYDQLARKYIVDCDVFQHTDGIAVESGRLAKEKNIINIADMRVVHPDFQDPLLHQEHLILGWKADMVRAEMSRRIMRDLAQADYVVVPSTLAQMTYIRAGIPQDRIFVVPYGVEPNQFNTIQSEYMQPKSIFRILYVGQISINKGLHYLIRAYKNLNLKDSELILIGGGNSRSIDYMNRLIDNAPGIKMLGHLPKFDLLSYYRQASIFILPSLVDSFGLVCLEAMACGVPVILSDNTGCKDLITDGVEGFIVPIRDVEVLQDRILYVYNRPGEGERMSNKALERAKKYTWDNYSKTLLGIYQSIH